MYPFKSLDFLGYPNYAVDTEGNIHNTNKDTILKPTDNGSHYRIELNNKWHIVHKLMALCFIDNPNKFTKTIFIDDDYTNKDISNLMYIPNNPIMTQELVKLCIEYNKDTGEIIVKRGKQKGTLTKDGYTLYSFFNKNYFGHRLAWLYTYGKFPDMYIDHINHDRTDNRIENLREVSEIDNARNISKRKDNTTGVNGVTYAKGKYRASIAKKYLGSFNTLEEAKQAREQANIELGYHENHGN